MTQQLKAGDKIPEFTFLHLKDGAPTPLSTDELFNGKRVVLFGLPGAFTPGCSKTHCPSFVLQANKLKAKGIDAVYCTAVNDCFVMEAWAADQGAVGKIQFLADGNADFARKTGLTHETGPFGGTRSARYALVAKDGVVEYLAIDQEGVKNTTAEALLEHL